MHWFGFRAYRGYEGSFAFSFCDSDLEVCVRGFRGVVFGNSGSWDVGCRGFEI